MGPGFGGEGLEYGRPAKQGREVGQELSRYLAEQQNHWGAFYLNFYYEDDYLMTFPGPTLDSFQNLHRSAPLWEIP